MSTEPRADTPPALSEDSDRTRPARVIPLRERRRDDIARRIRRELVERATVRECTGRSWEQDNHPAGGGLFGTDSVWQPR